MLQRIFRAMQVYGLIVADNGSDMFISGAMDNRWNNSELNPAFAALKAVGLRCRVARLALTRHFLRERIRRQTPKHLTALSLPAGMVHAHSWRKENARRVDHRE